MARRIDLSFRPDSYWPESRTPEQLLARIKGQAITIALAIVVGYPAADVHADCGPYMPWDTVGQATCADLDQPPAPAIDPRLVPLDAAALANALDRNRRASDAILERWRAEDAERHAAPSIVVPVPADGRARSYHSWDSSGMRWGTVEVHPSGDWQIWDSRSSFCWGHIER